MILVLAASFLCAMTPPAYVTDGDTFRCADGTRVRVAGVDANEMNGACHNVCAAMNAKQARDYAASLIMGRTIRCESVGTSYKRIVARCTLPDHRSLSYALIAHGAAVRWDRYWKKYGMGRCE
jgi:endonuclease YncB( thermonuclease family)